MQESVAFIGHESTGRKLVVPDPRLRCNFALDRPASWQNELSDLRGSVGTVPPLTR